MIRFACSNCSRLISVDEKYSGKKGKCPKCGGVVVVPERSTVIEFACENCGHKIKVPERHGGKKGACPKCKNAVVVPSPKLPPSEGAGTFSIVCSMCEETIQVPETSRGQTIECPACGSYIEASSGDVGDESEASIPPGTDEDSYQEETEEEYEESAGVDRRLITLISAVAVIAVVGLVILVAVLRPSRSQEEVADTHESPIELQLGQMQEFVERHIGLLEKGEIDEARQSVTPGLADDANRPQVEKLSQQIGESRIIEMDCTRTHRQQRPEGDQVLLRYNLRCEEGAQTVIVSVLRTAQGLTIDGIAAKDRFGREVSIGARSFAQLSRMGATVTFERTRAPRGQLLSALAVGFAIGTFISAFCLWAGMKITRVEGTFVAMLGIAAISSLASTIPVLLVPIGFMPCFGWLIGQIVMFVLICKWTDAEFWPDAVGMVLVAGLVGMFLRMFLSQFMAMA